MAFLRYKVVKGKKYYQWVRNYRENGKHKQEVLYHLGPDIPSPEAAIAAEKKEIARWRRKAANYRRNRARLEETILVKLEHLTRLYGGAYTDYTDLDEDDEFAFLYFVNVQDRIELLEAYRAFFVNRKDRPSSFDEWRRKNPKWSYMWDWQHPSFSYYLGLDELDEIYESGEYHIWEEECQLEIDLYRKIESFRELAEREDDAEGHLIDHEDKLHDLLELQKRYT